MHVFTNLKSYNKLNVIVFIISLVAVIIAIIIVNISFEEYKEEEPDRNVLSVGYNQWFNYIIKDDESEAVIYVSMMCSDCNVMSREEFAELYPDTAAAHKEELYSNKYLIFDLDVENYQKEPVDIREVTKRMVYKSTFNDDTNSVIYIGEYEPSVIEGKGRKSIRLAAAFNYEDWLPYSYERFIDKDIYLMLNDTLGREYRMVLRVGKKAAAASRIFIR